LAGIPTLRRDAGNTAFLVDSVTGWATGRALHALEWRGKDFGGAHGGTGGGLFGVKGLAMPVCFLLTFATCHTRNFRTRQRHLPTSGVPRPPRADDRQHPILHL